CAGPYGGTLARGETDQPASAIPADFVVREDLTKLVPVFQAAPLSRFQAVAHAMPVLRLSGNVPRLEGSPGFTVLGIPAHDLTSVRWRSDYSPLSRRELAQRLTPVGSVALQGVRLPADARRLVLPFRARGDELAVRAVVITHAGGTVGVLLGTTAARRLEAALPAAVRGGLLVSFIFDLTNTGLHG